MRGKKAKSLPFRKRMKETEYFTVELTGERMLDAFCGRALYKKAKRECND